jgi:hypothetical protein
LQREAEVRGWRVGDDIATLPVATAATDEKLFRYSGPRPQGKEAAIVMLADSIEASSRALPDPTPERLQEHIHKMIALRLDEGELSECDLTLRDLQKIESTFAHVLRGVMHHRIEYPAAHSETRSDNGRHNEGKHRRRHSTTRLPIPQKPAVTKGMKKKQKAAISNGAHLNGNHNGNNGSVKDGKVKDGMAHLKPNALHTSLNGQSTNGQNVEASTTPTGTEVVTTGNKVL